MSRVKSANETLESAKARGLMQVIERMIARHNRGECCLDQRDVQALRSGQGHQMGQQ